MLRAVIIGIALSALGSSELCGADSPETANQPRMPYLQFRMFLESCKQTIYQGEVRIEPSEDSTNRTPPEMYIDAKRGKIPLQLVGGKVLDFPFTDELARENPDIVGNWPKGTMNFILEFGFNFPGDVHHPYECTYRDIFAPYIRSRQFEAYPERQMSVAEALADVSGCQLVITPRKNVEPKGEFVEIRSRSFPGGKKLFSLTKTGIKIRCTRALWEENPSVLLGFDPHDVLKPIDESSYLVPYVPMRVVQETKKVGIFDVSYRFRDGKEQLPLSMYIDSIKETIPLEIKDGRIVNFPFTDELAKENPNIIANRHWKYHFRFSGHGERPITCTYRDLFAPSVFLSKMDRIFEGKPMIPVEELDHVPSLEMTVGSSELSVEVRSQKKPFRTVRKLKQKIKIDFDLELWKENPEVMISGKPEGGGAPIIFEEVQLASAKP